MAVERDIKYINKDFSDFRNQLVEYTKNYFPESYNDFSPSSPGMMFIEMASYVGDVLSFYQDTQLQETYLTYAKDPKNLYALAYMMGYKPKTTGVSEVEIEVNQLIDATGANYTPNWDQAAVIQPNAILKSTDSTQTSFIVDKRVDFTFSSSYDPTDIVIYELDINGNPETYKLTKKVKAFSGEIKSTSFGISTGEKFKTLTVQDNNIVGISNIVDQEGNNWYEVPFLGQDTIFIDEDATSSSSNSLTHILGVKKVPRRFVSRFLSSGYLQLQFGAGTNDTDDSTILPDASNLNIGSNPADSTIDKAYDPSNFLYSKTYGVSPTSDLTVEYIIGGGVEANVPANTINTAINVTASATDPSKLGATFLTYNNPKPATGGRDGDSVEELRENTLRAFSEQSRTITLQDYSVRALSLPSKFGSIGKVFATQDQLTNTNNQKSTLVDNNPLSVSLYVLSYDNNKKLVQSIDTVKENLKIYLSEYIPLTDSVNIKDAFVVNIGVNYDIVIRPDYSGRDVLLNCNLKLQEVFDIGKWNINQPINLSQIYSALDKVKGVQTVQKVEIVNKAGGNYSQYGYDTLGATRNNIVYPSFDPCIFEVKFPEQDIKGRITTL